METLQLNKDEIRAIGKKLGGGIKTEEELGELTKTLRKAILEAALGGELQTTWAMNQTNTDRHCKKDHNQKNRADFGVILKGTR